MLQLYDLAGAEDDRRFSPYCWRIKMALAHKGLAVETIPWRFTEKERLAPSGQGRVPVLVDDGRWVWDSWTIAGYLEEHYPDRPSLFGGGAGRALSRFYGDWTDTVLHGALIRLVVLDILNHCHEKDRAYFRKSREERFGATLETVVADRDARLPGLRDILSPLRLTLRTQPFLGGEGPLYPDYTVFGAFQWARAISPFTLLAADDAVHAWRGRMLALHDGLAGKAKAYPV
jgi:glutathione S-transferase